MITPGCNFFEFLGGDSKGHELIMAKPLEELSEEWSGEVAAKSAKFVDSLVKQNRWRVNGEGEERRMVTHNFLLQQVVD